MLVFDFGEYDQVYQLKVKKNFYTRIKVNKRVVLTNKCVDFGNNRVTGLEGGVSCTNESPANSYRALL
jgi:hypothetical protein